MSYTWWLCVFFQLCTWDTVHGTSLVIGNLLGSGKADIKNSFPYIADLTHNQRKCHTSWLIYLKAEFHIKLYLASVILHEMCFWRELLIDTSGFSPQKNPTKISITKAYWEWCLCSLKQSNWISASLMWADIFKSPKKHSCVAKLMLKLCHCCSFLSYSFP